MKRAVYFLLFFIFCLYYFSIDPSPSSLPLNGKLEEYFIKRNNGSQKEKVLIYAATKRGGTIMGQQYLWQCSKAVRDYCIISSNISDRPYADAVYYHNRDFKWSQLANVKDRSTYQVHVASTWESPSNEKLNYPPNYINWTMTYRKDSDIWDPYNRLVPKKSETSIDLEDLWSTKSPNLTTTGIASNCNTKNGRRDLIQKAAKYDQGIHLFGRCGTQLPNCGRNSPKIYDCAGEVAKNYYFYFAFENSNCQDYVTEKFYNALKWTVVPVVIKRKIYTDLGIPGEIFIALDDFDSVERLVTFLVELKKDKKRYLAYHQWRQIFEISQLGDDISFCALCQKLRQPIQERKWYANVGSWFSESRTCDNGYALHYL